MLGADEPGKGSIQHPPHFSLMCTLSASLIEALPHQEDPIRRKEPKSGPPLAPWAAGLDNVSDEGTSECPAWPVPGPVPAAGATRTVLVLAPPWVKEDGRCIGGGNY